MIEHDAPAAARPVRSSRRRARRRRRPPDAAAEELALLVFVADCLPIAVATASGVAMLHGGWRGLAAGIVERGAAGMSGGAAAIGPGIGPCCFEVGPEVLEAFADLGPGIAEGRMLDLPEVARATARSGPGVERRRALRPLHALQPGALLLPPRRRARTRAGRAGSPGGPPDGRA